MDIDLTGVVSKVNKETVKVIKTVEMQFDRNQLQGRKDFLVICLAKAQAEIRKIDEVLAILGV